MTTRRHEDQPSRNEDEFFAKQDAELIKQMRDKLDAERREQQKKQHYMKCPKCGSDLKEEDRGSVKVDVCPNCNGMWLDAGELDLMRQMNKSSSGGLFGGLFGPGKSARK